MDAELANVTPDNPFGATLAASFITECMQAIPATTAGAILLWDVMNEPIPLPSRVQWVSGSMAHVKQVDVSANGVSRTTLWSYRVTDVFPASIELATDVNCDVIGLHAYGNTRATLESLVYDAIFLDDGGVVGKPLICTEIGYPGIGMSYRDTIRYCRDRVPAGSPPGSSPGVPRPDLGGSARGIGFMPWAFMIGYYNAGTGWLDRLPFSYGTGLFYFDGQVREEDAVMAFVEHAIAQGIPANALWSRPGSNQSGYVLVQKAAQGDPHYVDPGLGANVKPAYDDYATLQLLLTAPSWFWQSTGWTYELYKDVATLFMRVSEAHDRLDIASLASRNNGNPVTAQPPPPGHHAYNPLLLQWSMEAQPGRDPLTGEPNNRAFYAMLTRLENQLQLCSGNPRTCSSTLRPWDTTYPLQAESVRLVAEHYLQPWAQMLAQYILPRGGPY